MGRENNKGVKGMEIGNQGSHTDRHGSKGLTWGSSGAVRVTTQAYRDNFDKIFGGAAAGGTSRLPVGGN
jgi:hypothetical protein